MIEQQVSTIDYYVWLLSDWAYLGGVRVVQLATRHGLKINHIPMRMQDVYAGSGGVLLANRSWQRQAYRITELKRWRSRLGIPVNIEPKFYPADVDLASCVVIAAQQRGLSTAPALPPHIVNPSTSLSAPASSPLEQQMQDDYATQLRGAQQQLMQQNSSGLTRPEVNINHALDGFTPR